MLCPNNLSTEHLCWCFSGGGGGGGHAADVDGAQAAAAAEATNTHRFVTAPVFSSLKNTRVYQQTTTTLVGVKRRRTAAAANSSSSRASVAHRCDGNVRRHQSNLIYAHSDWLDAHIAVSTCNTTAGRVSFHSGATEGLAVMTAGLTPRWWTDTSI